MSAALHRGALTVLRTWAAPSPAQRALRDRYVAHLGEHPDGLSRGCYPDHLTASTVVLSADRTQVLLTLHRKAGSWLQFGGHCEPADTTLAGAARREAVEESGLGSLALDPVPVHLDVHAVSFCHPRGGVRHLDVRFVAVAAAGGVPAVSEESLDVRWWPADQLPDPTGELLELVDLARRRATAPRGPIPDLCNER